MSKFNVGDRVRLLPQGFTAHWDVFRGEGVVASTDNGNKDNYITVSSNELEGGTNVFDPNNLELVTSKKGKKMTEPKKHLYRLKKDSMGAKKGIVVIEQCTDGTQDFNILEEFKQTHFKKAPGYFDREDIVDNPEWWEEVTIEYVPVKKLGRPKGKKQGITLASKGGWTPARRRAQSRKMKAYWAGRN